jgi:hypothetical protein
LFEESLALKRARADRRAVATTLSSLGDLARLQGHYGAALGYLRESLLIREELDDRLGLAYSLGNLAALALVQAAYRESAVLYGASHAIRQAIQMALSPIEQAEYEANLVLLQEKLGHGPFASAWSLGENQPLAETIDWALNEALGS